MYLSAGIGRFNNARQSEGVPSYLQLLHSQPPSTLPLPPISPINNNHLYRILITRSKQTNKRQADEETRSVRGAGLMLWWLQADLRSVGPPTSKMHLRLGHRSTCYECFNATVRSSFSRFASRYLLPIPSREKHRKYPGVIKLPRIAILRLERSHRMGLPSCCECRLLLIRPSCHPTIVVTRTRIYFIFQL